MKLLCTFVTQSKMNFDPNQGKQSEPLSLNTMKEFLRNQSPQLRLLGSNDSFSVATLLSQLHHEGQCPNLVVMPRSEDLASFAEQISFFDPLAKTYLLPGFDVGVYSHLYPNKSIMNKRMRWLHHAQSAKNSDIFLASVEGLLQNTIPFQVLSENTFTHYVGDDTADEIKEQLNLLGYRAEPIVEDVGTYSLRGGIIDVFSPAHEHPVRLELFADEIESIKFFSAETQRSLYETSSLVLIPPREVFFTDNNRQKVAVEYKKSVAGKDVQPQDVKPILHAITQGQLFSEADFLLPFFYEQLSQPMEHFNQGVNLWLLDPTELKQNYDQFLQQQNEEYAAALNSYIQPDYKDLFVQYEDLLLPEDSKKVFVEKIEIQDSAQPDAENLEFRVYSIEEFRRQCLALNKQPEELAKYIGNKLRGWRDDNYHVFISSSSSAQLKRIQQLLQRAELEEKLIDEDNFLWASLNEEQALKQNLIHLIPRRSHLSARLQSDKFVFLRDTDFFGTRSSRTAYAKSGSLENRTHAAVSFSDLKEGDLVVHKLHGLGVYDGLKVMPISGVNSEFIQLSYKGGDRLYVPVYRINQLQKFSGPSTTKLLDKLGGQGWNKTKKKVKKHLQDIASELLKLYSTRAQIKRAGFSAPDNDFWSFEANFPYQETPDQERAISEVITDMTGDKPMDRLICGDVGFGKTEVAMRATFKAVQDRKQVAIIAPTTILSFQHLESFKKRFKNWPVEIRALNRFVPRAQIKQSLEDIKSNKVDVVIGTHRLLSKDVEFANLGLLIVDEEQKFGVKHKERIRQMKTMVDTLAMSATPIPRTLNMSLVGLRDLSIINTAPNDRLPTRTFVCKFDKETIRRAIESELKRGGQVFFLHNRVNSIEALSSELREIVPHARFAIGHGQMDEKQLEKTMVKFFNKEVDVLVCTTIIESGMDIPNANTMFIDNAHQFGLSQLYQLRGRVGRSKDRAYCYLIVPQNKKIDADAQERLKIIQENTALGSGIRIAQHDLELRGAGDMLGAEQSGHINAVGYEMYLELLDEAIREQKGETVEDTELDPEINLRIPALIPDTYIPNIRIRLSYYKALSQIQNEADLDQIEDDLRDQFGKIPEPVYNLMGVMLIRRLCKDLGVKDLTASSVGVRLMFSDRTPFPPEKAIELSQRENKKYILAPDNKFTVRIKEVTWPRVYEELNYLLSFCKTN